MHLSSGFPKCGPACRQQPRALMITATSSGRCQCLGNFETTISSFSLPWTLFSLPVSLSGLKLPLIFSLLWCGTPRWSPPASSLEALNLGVHGPSLVTYTKKSQTSPNSRLPQELFSFQVIQALCIWNKAPEFLTLSSLTAIWQPTPTESTPCLSSSHPYCRCLKALFLLHLNGTA